MDKVLATGLCTGIVLLLASCTSLEPRRAALPDPVPIDCSPDKNGAVAPGCENQIVEVAEDYRLYLIEVDDQGRPYADRPEFGHAHHQVNEFLSAVREGVQGVEGIEGDDGGLSVVMFVHGWKHYRATVGEASRCALAVAAPAPGMPQMVAQAQLSRVAIDGRMTDLAATEEGEAAADLIGAVVLL
ncbi:MAG: hypothetical protein M3Q11_06495, partial [Pseudomonadota bacterium]|nr:hypothetical protein [Pseudomonadota bacterium]